jgi:hypothetical protein
MPGRLERKIAVDAAFFTGEILHPSGGVFVG